MFCRNSYWTHRLFCSFCRWTYNVPGRLFLKTTTATSGPVLFSSLSAFCLMWPFNYFEKPTLEQETRKIMGDAIALIRAKKYNSADAALHQILARLSDAAQANEISLSEYSGRRARVFSEMANLRLLQLNYGEAEALFVEAIRESVAGGMDPKDPAIIEISLKLALIYARFENTKKANTGFQFCYDTQLASAGTALESSQLDEIQRNNVALMGMVSNAYAKFLIRHGRLTEAHKKLNMALKCARQVYPPGHENCLYILADMASVESRLDNTESAQRHLSEAIGLAEQERAHLSLVRLYCTRAVIEANLGKFLAATDWLNEAEKACSMIEKEKHGRTQANREVRRIREMIESWKTEHQGEDVE